MKAIGLAFPVVFDRSDLDARHRPSWSGRDMRPSSVPLERALVEGLLEAGLDVIRVGLVTTPMELFRGRSSGCRRRRAGDGKPQSAALQRVQVQPPRRAAGVGGSRHPRVERRRRKPARSRGLGGPRASASEDHRHARVPRARAPLPAASAGGSETAPKLVVDAANGMGCLDQSILEAAGVDLDLLYFELDGTFPNHEPNPLKLENLESVVPARARPRRRSREWPSTATPIAPRSSTSVASRWAATSPPR